MNGESSGGFFRGLYNLLTGTEPYTYDQPCPHCGAQARFVREKGRIAHGYGALSDVEYECPNGHTFEKVWKARAVGDL